MTFGLVRSSASGASCLAVWRTISKLTVNVPPAGIVPVTTPSIGYGTSRPLSLRPSLRMYLTVYRVIVTSLLLVGTNGVAPPMSLSGARSVTVPVSSNTVGQGAEVVHGGGEIALVITSDSRLDDATALDDPPRDAASVSITRYTGELPSRTASPHEVAPATTSARPTRRKTLRMLFLNP